MMGYIVPAEVPAWQVEIWVLYVGFVALPVPPFPSSSHEKRVFRSKAAAERWGRKQEHNASYSLVPYRLEARLTKTSLEPDWWDYVLAFFNIRPRCGSLKTLYEGTHL